MEYWIGVSLHRWYHRQMRLNPRALSLSFCLSVFLSVFLSFLLFLLVFKPLLFEANLLSFFSSFFSTCLSLAFSLKGQFNSYLYIIWPLVSLYFWKVDRTGSSCLFWIDAYYIYMYIYIDGQVNISKHIPIHMYISSSSPAVHII